MSSSWWMLIHSRLPDLVDGFILSGQRGTPASQLPPQFAAQLYGFRCVRTVYKFSIIKEKRLWNFLTVLSKFFRLWLSLWVLASVFGAQSTCWKVTATITPARMLMYGKEASNRKQEIDRQHYTIPNQRPKDKHCGKI